MRRKLSKYDDIAQELGRLVTEKNAAYGDSALRAAEILKILYPVGIRIEEYSDLLLVVRILDKLCRIATNRDALGESPWRDIAGYGILGVSMCEVKSAK